MTGAPYYQIIREPAVADGTVADLLFIVDDLSDWSTLAKAATPGNGVVLLNGREDVLQQMADFLSRYESASVSAMHLFSHGSSGSLNLGSTILDNTSLDEHADLLGQIGKALTEDGDILLYGCNVAEGAQGIDFINKLARATAADIGASNNYTGTNNQGGDWILEVQEGSVEGRSIVPNEPYTHILAPLDQTFDAVSVSITSEGLSYNLGDVTYTLSGVNVSPTFAGIYIIDDGYIAAGSDHALLYYNDYLSSSVVNQVSFKSFDGSEFKLNSFVISTDIYSFGTPGLTVDVTVKGYRDGLEVASIASFTTQPLATFDVSANSNWQFIDEVRITGNKLDIAIDDLDFSAAVPPPLITNVTSSTSNGSYKNGDVVSVQVTFSQAVIVTGTPQLTLETGSTDRTVNYSSGSGSTTLTFTYAVQAGDTSADLDYTSTTALTLNGGTIVASSDGTSAVLTLPSPGAAGSLGANKAIVIDTTAPSAPSTPDVTTGSDSGSSTTDNITKNTTPTFTGTAEPNATVTLYDTDGTTVLGTGTATGGNWSITSLALNAGAHTITAKASDIAGNVSLASSGLTVTIDTTDPVITTTVGSLTYAENGAATAIDNSATLSEAGSPGSSVLTVQITANAEASDTLALPTGTNSGININGTDLRSGTTNIGTVTASSVNNNTTWTLTFLSSATAADVQGVIQAITFASTSEAPSAVSRTVTFNLTDGAGNSGSAMRAIAVTAVNDDPAVASLPTDITVIEELASNVDLSAATFSDADSGANNITLTIAAGAGSLSATSGGGVTIAGSDSSTLTLSGTVSNIDTYLNTASNIKYTGEANAAGDNVTILTLTANDGGNTGTGGGANVTLGTVNVDITDTPDITSATYDYSTNQLVVTGNGFSDNGGGSDVDVSKLTLTGEGGATYTLASSADVEISSAGQFTVTLSGADLTSVEALLDKDGSTSATSGTNYNLAAADNFITSVTAGDTADSVSSITVSNYSAPEITSATYDTSTGQLVLNGSNFVSKTGAANDVDASLLSITGEGGSYTLTDTADVDVTSATSVTLTLSAADQVNVNGLLNKNGTASSSGTTYNLAAAEDWMTGSPASINVADLTGNGITVSNIQTPTITSATYDSDTGILTVTGTNLFRKYGSSNDIDISTLALTGGTGNATYTITSASDVEITSSTSFNVTLSGADKTSVDALLDQLGTTSSGGSTYNLAAADNWLAAADTATDISDATNTVTVSISPKITSATYDASSGTLVVTGSNIQANGGSSDIDASRFTITGEGGQSYTLTDTPDVERDSLNQFTLTLSAADKAAINQIVNKVGTSSTSGTSYNLAAVDDWDTNVTTGDISDLTGNSITVSNVATPTITTSTYDAATGSLVVTGTGFLKLNGAANDIDVSKLTITGEGGTTYTLTDTSDVEITSATAFNLTLSATDKAAINQILNKNGTASTSATTYNLAAAEDWAAGADSAVAVADLTSGMTVSNVAVPDITSATYNTSTGVLVATGTGFLKKNGASNDIDASMLIFRGEGNATYTLTDTSDVDISSGTSFSLTLSSTDKAAVNALLNKSGLSSNDNTIYNLNAAEDWASGADASVNVVDSSAGITVTLSNTGSGGGQVPQPEPAIPPQEEWNTLPDSDGDGVPEIVESFVPGLQSGTQGDGNGDGIVDKQQDTVTSVPVFSTSTPISNPGDAPQVFVTLVADSAAGKPDTGDGNTATLNSFQQLDAPADRPSDISMPLGLFGFTAEVETPGQVETFSLYIDGDISVNGYWKQNSLGLWVNLASEEYGGRVVEEGGKTRLDFIITDGGEFDNDGKADGTISDPGAPSWRDIATTFDEAYYLESKLDQLQSNGKVEYTNVTQVKDAIIHAGMTVFEHYERYSLLEGTNPSTLFNTNEYLQAKAVELNSIKAWDKVNWSIEEVRTAFLNAGYTNAMDHFIDWGWQEDVNPSNLFDVSEYFATKALQVAMTIDQVKEAFVWHGLDPLTHYTRYGQYEQGVTLTEVENSERVPVDAELASGNGNQIQLIGAPMTNVDIGLE